MFQLIERTVDQTISLLHQSGYLLSVNQSLTALGEHKTKCQLLMLYEHYFPLEFFSSVASLTSHGYTDLPDEVDESLIANEREREFFKLINEHFFPLTYDVLDDEWDEHIWRPHSIPVAAMGLDWWNTYPDDLPWACRVALILLNDQIFIGSEESAIEEVQDYFEKFPNIPMPHQGKTNWELFAQLCTKAKGYYVTVPMLLDYLSHSTGNALLDNTPENDTSNIEWCFEWIDHLREAYLDAKEKDRQIWELIHWLDEKPQRWKKIFQCWNRATKPILEAQNDGDPDTDD